MGVDFLVCTNCGDTFPDCGYYVGSCGCGKKWCSNECAYDDGFMQGDDYEYNGWSYEGDRTCKYCRKEDATDYTLFSFLLTRYGLTREDVLEQWKTSLRVK